MLIVESSAGKTSELDHQFANDHGIIEIEQTISEDQFDIFVVAGLNCTTSWGEMEAFNVI